MFDPIFISLQIVAMQCLYYLAMGTLLGLIHATFDLPSLTLNHFFSSSSLNFSTGTGFIDVIGALLSGLIGAYLLSIIVERAKKCVDFTFTLFFIHIVICTMYIKFPLEWQWWLVEIISSVTMATVGEYLCARNELEDIPLYSTSMNIV